MKYKQIYTLAKEIDTLNFTPPKKVLEKLKKYSPKYIGRGGYKKSFLISVGKRKLVFKVGRDIITQYQIYLDRKYSRDLKYAKIYWITEKCLLQRYCKHKKIPKVILYEMKKIAKQYGYIDWRPANVGVFGKDFVAFDLTLRKGVIKT